MKKQLFNALLIGLLAMPAISTRADVIDKGQTTEGKDFWVTFLKADSYDGDDKSIQLSLTISAKEACDVTIENKYSHYSKTISLAAGELHEDTLYIGTAKAAASNKDTVKCYSIHRYHCCPRHFYRYYIAVCFQLEEQIVRCNECSPYSILVG